MRRWTALLIAVGVCSATAHGQVEPPRRGTDELRSYEAARLTHDKAVKLFSKRDWEGARRWARESAAKYPDHSAAHLLHAKAAYMMKDYEDALAAIDKAESTFDAYAAVGGALMTENKELLYRKRRQIQDELVDLGNQRPANVQAADAISRRATDLQGQLQELNVEIQDPALAARPSMPAEYPFLHGNILLRLNRLDEAEPHYKRALEIEPKYPEAINNLASLYYSTGRGELALIVVNDAEAHGVTVNPELKKALLATVK